MLKTSYINKTLKARQADVIWINYRIGNIPRK